MGYKVLFKSKALGQLDALHTYISRHDSQVAKVVVARLRVFFLHLKEFPHLGKSTDESDVYRFSVGKTGMVVFYTFDGETITIISIIHARQLKQ